MASRRSENQKASNLRKRVRDGGQLTDDEKSWLDNYESTKRKPGRPPGPRMTADDLPEPVNLDDDSDPEPSHIPPPPEPHDIPIPPRIAVGDASPRHSGKWQDKYRNAEHGGTGRERTCVLIASYWLQALKSMEESLKAAGVEPIIEVQALAPSIVLTVDEILPDHVEFSPRVVAVGGSTALAVQRFMRREDVAKAQKTAKERATYQEWKERRHEPSPPTDISSHPDYNRVRTDGSGEMGGPGEANTEAPSVDVAPQSQPPVVTRAARSAIQAAAQTDPIDPDGPF